MVLSLGQRSYNVAKSPSSTVENRYPTTSMEKCIISEEYIPVFLICGYQMRRDLPHEMRRDLAIVSSNAQTIDHISKKFKIKGDFFQKISY